MFRGRKKATNFATKRPVFFIGCRKLYAIFRTGPRFDAGVATSKMLLTRFNAGALTGTGH